MNQKWLQKFYFTLYSVAVLFFICLPLWVNIEYDFISISISTLVISLFTYRAFKAYKNLQDDEPEKQEHYFHIEKIRRLENAVIVFALLVAASSSLIIYDFVLFEKGEVTSVYSPQPIAFLYSQFGFIPAVLFLPVLGSLLIMRMLWQIKKLKNLPE